MSGFAAAALLAAWERGSGEAGPQRAATLLAAGTGRGVDEVAALDVGSREVHLARLLVAAVGPVAATAVDCDGCGCPLDVPVDVATVARMPAYAPGERFELDVAGLAVSFRLPTGADLAELTAGDPDAARRELIARCVRWPSGELPGPVVAAVEAAMESTAPAAAVDIAVHCGGCGAVTGAALDVAALLWAEVAARAAALLRDVHELARAYGWTEAEVLALGARRRAAYLELVEA